jgi:hypothetical protein
VFILVNKLASSFLVSNPFDVLLFWWLSIVLIFESIVITIPRSR